jgi:hypothetical protein
MDTVCSWQPSTSPVYCTPSLPDPQELPRLCRATARLGCAAGKDLRLRWKSFQPLAAKSSVHSGTASSNVVHPSIPFFPPPVIWAPAPAHTSRYSDPTDIESRTTTHVNRRTFSV